MDVGAAGSVSAPVNCRLEAVLKEFESISERGGVLGAMELGYQRGKIQEESLQYERLKHTGEYSIIGVNTFRNPNGDHVPDPSSSRARPKKKSRASSNG